MNIDVLSFRSSKSHRSKRHHHYDHYKTEDLLLRRQKGSEVRLDIMMQSEPTEVDEAKMLHKVDLDEMASKSCLPFSQNIYPCPFLWKKYIWWILIQILEKILDLWQFTQSLFK